MTTKQLDIKNKTYYFYNNLINVSNFEPVNLKLDKKTWKDIDIYYLGYVDKSKPSEWRINSVNPLFVIFNKVFCFVGRKNSIKYSKIDKGMGNLSDSILNKWEQVFSSIKYHINKTDNIDVNFDSDYDKIKFVTGDSLPLGKLIYFPTLTVVIRCVFKQGDIFYPQDYLDDALYQL